MAVHESLSQRIVVRLHLSGLPRRINRIAHYTLSAAALAKSRLITARHLQCAVEEVQ